LREIYATLTAVFPNVQTWWTSSGDLMLVASAEPIDIDAGPLRARLETEPYRSATMNTWRVSSAEGFLAHMFANEDFADAAAEQAETMNTDDRTVIEFGFARSIDKGASLHSQIAADATRMGATRPRNLRGTLDWSAVERQRAWVKKREPSTIGELSAAALKAAHEGDSRAEEWSQLVRRVQPIEADLILATLRTKQQRYDEATGLLQRSLLGYRKSAWPDDDIMAEAFELATELARTRPDRARALEEALAQPFAAMQHEQTRILGRILIAPIFDSCGPRTIEALRVTEPNPIWTHQTLSTRAKCYAATGADLARQAMKDLSEFEDAEQSHVVSRDRP